MMYRLLALNIDGTILNNQGRLTKETKEAIDYVKDKGVYVTVVTNRHFSSAKKIAKTLRLHKNQLITHSGAFIASNVDKPAYERRISENKTFNLVQVLENFDCHTRILHEKFSLGNRVKIHNQVMAKAVLKSNEPLFYPIQFVESLGETLRDNPVSAPKIELYFQSQYEKEQAERTIASAFDIEWISYPNEPRAYIVEKGTSKEHGVYHVATQLGISLEEVVAIGNCYDDLGLVESVGLGVAMGNAPDKVKKAAGWVTRSNNENGVAYMVKELFRKQHRISYLEKIGSLDKH
ncbi:Cof-type HAD-IIB family hydrolase [Priestia endophytica]|uniref:Cof-type HAD-IIB family hydrolase n=1 Tax=Priestia endophytica TaxID=135735 RepID=UPI002041EAB0|nr:Cof-type HAD-IIB family hydrolase [Priestia endophytica]MCM3536435.1 Cof-type HAD-IIB family hydrolase [Priestia endophytica]